MSPQDFTATLCELRKALFGKYKKMIIVEDVKIADNNIFNSKKARFGAFFKATAEKVRATLVILKGQAK